MKFSIIILLGFVIINSFWLLPYFTFNSTVVQDIETFDERQFLVFRTAADATYHPLVDTAAMYGFWGERQHRFVNQKEIITQWFWIYLILLAIIIWGIAQAFIKDKERKKLWLYLSLIIMGVVSWVLAVGIGFYPFKALMSFLYDKVPLFKGYRDPHKFISLTILFYIYFGALGVNDIIKRFQNIKLARIKKLIVSVVILILLLLPVLYSQGILWGFRGQLTTSWYPESWFEINSLLNQDKDNFQVIFFPWHQYLSLSFSDYKVIANPAFNFFDKEVITGDNMQISIIQSTSSRPISRFIEDEVLPQKNTIYNLGELLAPWDIKYIILALESDFFNYSFLQNQQDLEQIYYKDKIMLYKNTAWGK